MTYQYIGVDVSKRSLDVQFPNRWMCVNNTKTGFKQLIEYCIRNQNENATPLFVCEATGGYERGLLTYLSKQGYTSYLAHANKVKSFAKMKGYAAKTDRIDAKIIREYALTMTPSPTPSKLSGVAKELGMLLKRRNQLVSDKRREKNRLEKVSDTNIKQSILSHIQWIKLEIEKIEKLARGLQKRSKAMQESIALLETIPAVGPLIAQYSVAFLPELGQLSHKKIAALVGVAPFNHDSGRYKGKRFITAGRKHLRDVLYMAAVVSMRCDPQLKGFYHKLKTKGKPTKVALIAVLRKLLMCMNSVMKRRTPWQKKMPALA